MPVNDSGLSVGPRLDLLGGTSKCAGRGLAVALVAWSWRGAGVCAIDWFGFCIAVTCDGLFAEVIINTAATSSSAMPAINIQGFFIKTYSFKFRINFSVRAV